MLTRPDVDAGEARDLGIAADGVEHAPGGAVPQEGRGDNDGRSASERRSPSGTPKCRSIASIVNQSGKPTICCPSVIMFARPRATDIIASVAMKGGTWKAVMSTPDTIPQRPAATRAIRIETGSGTPP